MTNIHMLETTVSLSSSAYIVHENYDQVTIVVTSSSVTPTEFGVELHVTTGSASGITLLILQV